jgi:hypothetical protein
MQVGGSAQDTTLLSPYRLNATRQGVYLVDFIGKRLMRFNHAGTLLWTFGRAGGGPEEFGDPRDMKVDREGRAWVLDGKNVRLTVVDSSGRLVRTVPLGGLDHRPVEVVPARGDTAVLLTDDPKATVLLVDQRGRELDASPLAWKGFRELDYLAAQLITGADPASGRWAAAFRVGDGFFLFPPAAINSSDRKWYVEPVPFPEVVVERAEGVTRTRHRSRPIQGATSITYSPTRVYVLFGGQTPMRRRIVDSYDRVDGRYTGSFILPGPVMEIAWHSGGLYTIQDDPFPELAYLAPDHPLP